MECSVCMSTKKGENVSTCTTCKGTGVICHACVQKWATAGHNPWICTICKNPNSTMRNMPYALYPSSIYLLVAIPRAAIASQVRILEQLDGFSWLVTLYGTVLLISISAITFMFVYVALLLALGAMRYVVLAVEFTILTIEQIT